MLLNCTSRKQVEKVLPKFIKRWPSAASFMYAVDNDVIELCKTLGFATRRTQNLKAMTERYVASNWQHASELPGVGEYASRCWEIFCLGQLSDGAPKDHALVRYHAWARNQVSSNIQL
jgi:adenine-specific DNA glycosylase